MITFYVSVSGLEMTLKRVGKVRGVMDDMTPIWEAIEADFYVTEAARFDAEGGEDGRWRPLSPAYALSKARTHPGRKILERDGQLKRSLTARGQPFGIRRVDARRLTLGTSDPKAMYHQIGTDRMPMREVIHINPSDEARWVQIAERVIQRAGADA